MKLLIVTQYFYPENFRINDLALELKKRGHEVTVFTGEPNYPEGDFYTGYHWAFPPSEVWKGIEIIRSPLFPRKRGKLHLILNYFSFAFFSSIKAWCYKWSEYDAIYVFETSPITVAFPAIVIKKKKKIPLIMNVQDLWPENVTAITNWTAPSLIYCLERMVRYIYSKCDLILAASNGFIPSIQKYCGNTQKNKVVFWPQYSVVTRAEKLQKLYEDGYFHVVFTGNLGEAQGLEMVIEAASKLRNTKIRWHLVGDGRNRNKLEQLAISYNVVDYVLFHGRKPENEIPDYLKAADAALLILKPNPIFDMTIPAKLQTYLSCGIPILGCVNGEAKKLIQQEHVGITCEKVSVQELINTVLKFSSLSDEALDTFQKNALACNDKYFNKDTLINQLEKYIESLRYKYV